MVELKEFVTNSILAVLGGVKDAQFEAVGNALGGRVADPSSERGSTRGELVTREIEFDVQVTATSETAGKAGSGIFVGPVGIGAQSGTTNGQQSMSRIKFVVPVSYPR